MVEKEGVQTVQTRNFIWNGSVIKEERDANNNVVKRFYGQGVQVVSGAQAGNYFYERDHLGSIKGLLDATGAEIASYGYDLWGNRTVLSGSVVSDFGYAGYFEHGQSGLKLTWFRGYSAGLGRWISRDPMGESAGTNLYGYVGANPISMFDPLGLCQGTPTPVPSSYLRPRVTYSLEAQRGFAKSVVVTAAGVGILVTSAIGVSEFYALAAPLYGPASTGIVAGELGVGGALSSSWLIAGAGAGFAGGIATIGGAPLGGGVIDPMSDLRKVVLVRSLGQNVGGKAAFLVELRYNVFKGNNAERLTQGLEWTIDYGINDNANGSMAPGGGSGSACSVGGH